MGEQPNILYTQEEDGVATITLNRPEKLNAFTHAMIDDWGRYIADAGNDPAVKVVLLAGSGRAFCVGADADEMDSRGKQDELARKNFLWQHVHKIALTMERMDKPVIAAVNGLARGAGADMALMCDIRIAGESTSFAWSYVNLNVIAGDGGTYYLPKIIGMPRALELFWTGRTVTAVEADRIGLVNRVVPDADLSAVSRTLAKQIAAQPKDSIQFYRRAAYQGETQTLYSHLDMISSHMAVLRGTPENHARIAAFREQRRKGKVQK